jgi:hypothetical protein
MSVAEQIVGTKPDTATQTQRCRMLIDGAWVDSMSGKALTVENPQNAR